MSTSRRAAGLGLLAYGIGTPLAFMAIGSPGGDYQDSAVGAYLARGHWWTAFGLAYLGAFAALGLLVFGRHMREELGRSGSTVWGLSVAGTAVGVVGWFLVGGVAVAAAEGGAAVTTVPHPVIYVISEMSNLIAVCAPAFLLGTIALVLAARARLPIALRTVTALAGICGILAAFYFPAFVFWLWAILFGAFVAASRARRPEAATLEVQPV